MKRKSDSAWLMQFARDPERARAFINASIGLLIMACTVGAMLGYFVCMLVIGLGK